MMYYCDSLILSYKYRINFIIKFLFFRFLAHDDIRICEIFNSPNVKRNTHFDREQL